MADRTMSWNEAVYGGRLFNDAGSSSPYNIGSRSGSQVLIWSNGHYCWQDPKGINRGGDFLLTYDKKENGIVDIGTVQATGAYHNYHLQGSVGTATSFGFLADTTFSPEGYAASMYAKMKPDRPDFSGFQSVYELKDLPGMLKMRLETLLEHQKIGQTYLAYQFGWKPLLSDIRDFVLTQRKAQETLAQLIRDEGKPVRRSIKLFDTVNITAEGTGPGHLYPTQVGYFYPKAGNYRNTIGTRDRVWGSARFRYWLPGGPRDINWRRSMIRKLYGFNVTPETVWKIMPWSWLVDWFGQLDGLLSNLQTTIVDRLAADYFYVMRRRDQLGTNTVTDWFYREKTMEVFSATATGYHVKGSKCRMRGDPFGWATPENSLKGTQLAILGALGLSRLR